MSWANTFQQLGLPNAILSNAAASTLLPVAMGTAIGFSTRPKDTQNTYLALRQPPLRPPAWAFGPVWTVLYGCMGYAAHRAWTTGLLSPNPSIRDLTYTSSALFTVQMGLNLIWMPLFFGIKRPALALADILCLDASVLALTINYFDIDPTAGWLMVPYCAWLAFATYINIGVGVLNDWDLKGKETVRKPGDADTRFVDEKKRS